MKINYKKNNHKNYSKKYTKKLNSKINTLQIKKKYFILINIFILLLN